MPVPVVFGTKTEYIDDPEGAKDEEGNVKRVPVEERIVNDTDAIWLKSRPTSRTRTTSTSTSSTQ